MALRIRGKIVLSTTLSCTLALLAAHRPAAAAALGRATGDGHNFSLLTIDGSKVSLADDSQGALHVVCFLGTECPLARLYGPRLEKLAQRYKDRGVRFIGVNSNVQDSLDEIRQYVADHHISFPMAKDPDRRVARQMGATRTPEVFLVDRSGTIRYQGRIDDQYQPGITRSEATTHDLQNALEELLAGKPVTTSRTLAVGCLIALPKETRMPSGGAEVTFCRQISRILNNHCVECHREGEIGPFALEDYDEVVGWADMALEVIDQGRMPPWHANSPHGTFANDRHMPPEEVETLRRWVAAGMPYGEADDLPPRTAPVAGWRLPEPPHAVFAMSAEPYSVAAEGTIEYQYFVVDPHFTEDKWVSAVQVVPGNRAVVHHSIAFVRPPDGSSFRDIGLLAAYVPGQRLASLPQGFAQRIPAGSRIVFQMHYTPTGKPEQDLTRLGMVFVDPAQVTHRVYSLGGIEQEFEIPPHAANHKVEGKFGWFPRDGLLLSVAPHMHLRGKSFRFIVERQDGVETLLDVPHYDFNWQHNYQWKTPLPLDAIHSLRFTATFDNSAANPVNPHPEEYVTWGDQTWQEMAVAFVAVAEPVDGAPARLRSARAGNAGASAAISDATIAAADAAADAAAAAAAAAAAEEAVRQQSGAFADNYIARFDQNGDGRLAPHELPDSIRMFAFRDFDHDHDRLLSRDEIAAEAHGRLARSR